MQTVLNAGIYVNEDHIIQSCAQRPTVSKFTNIYDYIKGAWIRPATPWEQSLLTMKYRYLTNCTT
jgi:hypothetical protein